MEKRWDISIRATGIALAVTGLFFFGNAHALDDKAISQWIGTMEDWHELGERDAERGDEFADEDIGPDTDFERMLTESARQHSEVEALIRDNGYSGVEEWASVGSRIFKAVIAMESRMGPEEQAEMQREMERGLQQMEDHPQLSAEQKAQMRAQMEHQMEVMRGMSDMAGDVPARDLEAVERNRAAILRVMEEDPR